MVWDIFGLDLSASRKWSVNLSDSKLYIDAKILSLGEKNHFTTYIYELTQFQQLGGQKNHCRILHRGKNLEYINIFVCHPPIWTWWIVYTSYIHNNLTNISTNTTRCEKYKCHIHISLDQTIKHTTPNSYLFFCTSYIHNNIANIPRNNPRSGLMP